MDYDHLLMDEVGDEEEPLVGLYIDYDDRNLLDTGGNVPPPAIAKRSHTWKTLADKQQTDEFDHAEALRGRIIPRLARATLRKVLEVARSLADFKQHDDPGQRQDYKDRLLALGSSQYCELS